MKPGEEKNAIDCIWGIFEEFETSWYTQEEINEFRKFISPEKIKVQCKTGENFILGYKDIDEIVGIISIKGNSHISLLFVKKEYPRKGIARRLFELAFERCCAVNPNLQAAEVYEKIGFQAVDSEQ